MHKEPTSEECSQIAKVYEGENRVAYALWYPQMGGYVSKCVAEFDRQWHEHENGATEGGCIELFVWHDGEFPFGGGNPTQIHICAPEQFVEFGRQLAEINDRGKKIV